MRCQCGNQLIAVLGEETIKTLDGQVLVFRRRTDYLLCRACLKLYSVLKLRGRDLGDDLPHIGEERRLPGYAAPLIVGDVDDDARYAIDIEGESIEEIGDLQLVELSGLTEEERRQLAELTQLPESDNDPVPLEDQFGQ